MDYRKFTRQFCSFPQRSGYHQTKISYRRANQLFYIKLIVVLKSLPKIFWKGFFNFFNTPTSLCSVTLLKEGNQLIFFFEVKNIIFPVFVLSLLKFFSVSVYVNVEIFIQFNNAFQQTCIFLYRNIINRKIV